MPINNPAEISKQEKTIPIFALKQISSNTISSLSKISVLFFNPRIGIISYLSQSFCQATKV